jgi:soluble lytic murein transglycosylase-like protein
MACAPVTTYDALIAGAGRGYGVDPALIKAHMSVESSFNPHATNLEGSGVNPSVGLMQVRYSTAQALGYPGALGNSQQLTGLYDPGINVPLAAKLIRENLDRAGGDVDAAISAYNGGWQLTKGFGYRFADGTFGNQGYVEKVQACYRAYAGTIPVIAPTPGTGPAPSATQAGTAGLTTAGAALMAAGIVALLYWLWQRVH